jgi:hypothetical protein
MLKNMMIAAVACAGLLVAGDDAEARKRRLPQQQLLNQIDNVQRGNLNGWNNRGLNNLGNLGSFRGGQAPAEMKGFDGVLTAAKVATAIDDAVLFLKRAQQPDGGIGERSYARGGPTGLAALAMLAAGVHPVSDPQLARALEWLGKLETNNTYVVGIRANVWEYALRKQPDNETWRKALWRDAEWLLSAMNEHGAWRYNQNSRDFDNSCSQYGVLGLWAAARAGFDPGDGFWDKVSNHFRKVQNEDGGWGYTNGGSSANMATAGLASLFLVFDMHHGKQVYSRKTPRAFKEGAAADVLARLERGMKWLGERGGANTDGYYLYGIERTGVASGRKYIGGRDWFREGAMAALQAQRADGSIPTSRTPVIGTAFSTLFMVYGGAPVAFNKLQYGPGQDWNLNPRDLANLTKHLWSAYEAPLNWHSVSVDDPVAEFEAPILFISGTEAANFTPKQIETLRTYIHRGGTILAEPTDGAAAFKLSMETLVQRLYPKRSDRRLKPLAADHPLFTAAGKPFKASLRGVSDGSRLVFLLSDDYLSGAWQMNETVSPAFALAHGLLAYVTDRQQMIGKFHSLLPGQPAAPKRDRQLRVVHASVDGSPSAETSVQTWRQLNAAVTHQTGAPIKDLGVVQLAALPTADLLHITGRAAFTLDAAQRAALETFVARGGTVLVDAWAGETAFAEAARRELSAVFGTAKALDDTSTLAAGRYEGGSDLSRELRYTLPARRALLAAGVRAGRHQLEVFEADGRPAVIFSRYDLSAAAAGISIFGARGYRPTSARRIITNVAGYLVRPG